MLQRSPSYVMSLPEHDGIADLLRHLLPERLAYPLVRWKNVVLTTFVYQLCRRAPRLMARLLKKGVASQLPADFDVETHFSPRYSPWDQRLCFVPDGDLFKALSSGRASVVTGQIERLTGDGVLLDSGATLDADIIVSATGLNMQMLGGMAITVDGRPLDLAESVAYKGIMLCGVPNLAFTIGYTNASWTLKADLAARYVCRLLNYMDERGARSCRPIPPDPQVPRIPLMDLTSGYVRRSVDRLPKQAATMPWRLHQNYPLDIMMLRRGPLDDQMAFDDGDGDGSSDMDDAARGVAVVN
jgi:cation diffusion facilitator CzcD-associated flavoprotein CzcO